MSDKNKLPKKYLVLTFKCKDLETYLEDPKSQCCQYCMHLKEENKPIEEWVCKMPSREAQRRHFAGLDQKQQRFAFIGTCKAGKIGPITKHALEEGLL